MERLELEAKIEEAFRGVQRVGVSWSEARVIDNYGTDAERFAARSRDMEAGWCDLVDDPNWVSEPGIGGWSFLDAGGFRYYLPAVMIRSLRSGFDEGITSHLTLPTFGGTRSYVLEQWSLLDHQQRVSIKHFLRYMVASTGNEGESEVYRKQRVEYEQIALDRYWEGIEG